MPLTAAQARLMISRATGERSSMQVSMLELTFDVTGVQVQQLRKRAIHRAHITRTLVDDQGRSTLYVGSPRSSWQVRIYDKTSSVVRIEFVLRRSFLSKHKINTPEDIVLL